MKRFAFQGANSFHKSDHFLKEGKQTGHQSCSPLPKWQNIKVCPVHVKLLIKIAEESVTKIFLSLLFFPRKFLTFLLLVLKKLSTFYLLCTKV